MFGRRALSLSKRSVNFEASFAQGTFPSLASGYAVLRENLCLRLRCHNPNTYAWTCTRTRTHTHIHTQAELSHKRITAMASVCTDLQGRHVNTHTHTPTHTHTNTHTHTHTHTHHTHTRIHLSMTTTMTTRMTMTMMPAMTCSSPLCFTIRSTLNERREIGSHLAWQGMGHKE